MRCFAECVQHVTGLAGVPGPSDRETLDMGRYYRRLGEFLAGRGWVMVSIDREGLRPGGGFRAWISAPVKVIAGGPSAKVGSGHAVVGRLDPVSGKLHILYDPHEDAPGIDTWEDVWLLIKA